VHCVFAFEFHNYSGLNHQIGSKSAVELDAIVDHGHGLLSLNSLSKSLKFVSQAGFVRGFEQAGTKPAMDCYCGTNDFVTKIARHMTSLVVHCWGYSEKIVQSAHFGNPDYEQTSNRKGRKVRKVRKENTQET
jgi:hypothetical protein